MDQRQVQEVGNNGLRYVLDHEHLEDIICSEYSVPLFGIDNNALAKTIYYPKELGLFSDFLIVYFQISNDIGKPIFHSGPFILSKEPRKKGKLKWNFLKKILPTPLDLVTPLFYTGSGEEESTVVISMGSQRRFIVPSFYLHGLTKYEKSHSDYLVYCVTFQWLKHMGLDVSILDESTQKSILSDMWIKIAYEDSFGQLA